MKTERLAIAEHFLSIQGEGRTQGKPAYFLRLAGCNLMCGGYGTEKDGELHGGATWRCDSIEVWLKGKKKTHEELVEAMGGPKFLANLSKGYHLIITGGEPLLQQNEIKSFLNYLLVTYSLRPLIEIETNGTVMPSNDLISMVDLFNVSPKLSNSGMPYDKRILENVLIRFDNMRLNQSIFKVVVSNRKDFDEFFELAFNLELQSKKIWIMPAADNRDELIFRSGYVAKWCIENGYSFSNRLHIQIWDKKTGV